MLVAAEGHPTRPLRIPQGVTQEDALLRLVLERLRQREAQFSECRQQLIVVEHHKGVLTMLVGQHEAQRQPLLVRSVHVLLQETKWRSCKAGDDTTRPSLARRNALALAAAREEPLICLVGHGVDAHELQAPDLEDGVQTTQLSGHDRGLGDDVRHHGARILLHQLALPQRAGCTGPGQLQERKEK